MILRPLRNPATSDLRPLGDAGTGDTSITSPSTALCLDLNTHGEQLEMNLELLTRKLDEFAAERDWEQFHTPKNLAIALTVEATELLEIFQWSRGQRGWEEIAEPDVKERVEEELADVLLYLLRFADLAQIDLEAAALKKIERNRSKYPVDLSRGTDKKYDELS